MLISPAYAQADGVAGAGDGLLGFLPMIAIVVVFYFLLIRPQQKRMKEHRQLVAALKRGDHVVTGGGIIGTVTRVTDKDATVEIADGVRIKVVKTSISEVVAKPQPASSMPADDEGDEDGEGTPSAADVAPPVPPKTRKTSITRRGS